MTGAPIRDRQRGPDVARATDQSPLPGPGSTTPGASSTCESSRVRRPGRTERCAHEREVGRGPCRAGVGGLRAQEGGGHRGAVLTLDRADDELAAEAASVEEEPLPARDLVDVVVDVTQRGDVAAELGRHDVGLGLRDAHAGRVEHGWRGSTGHRCEGSGETLGVVAGDVAELGQPQEHGVGRRRSQGHGRRGVRRAPAATAEAVQEATAPRRGSSVVAGAVEHSACAASRASRTTSGGGTITASSCMRGLLPGGDRGRDSVHRIGVTLGHAPLAHRARAVVSRAPLRPAGGRARARSSPAPRTASGAPRRTGPAIPRRSSVNSPSGEMRARLDHLRPPGGRAATSRSRSFQAVTRSGSSSGYSPPSSCSPRRLYGSVASTTCAPCAPSRSDRQLELGAQVGVEPGSPTWLHARRAPVHRLPPPDQDQRDVGVVPSIASATAGPLLAVGPDLGVELAEVAVGAGPATPQPSMVRSRTSSPGWLGGR